MTSTATFQPILSELQKLQIDTQQEMEAIVLRYWDLVSFENKARKDSPRDERAAAPGYHRPTKLSLQIKRAPGAIYVNWVTQHTRILKTGAAKTDQPYKKYIPKGAKNDAYPDSSLIKHMSGWERDIVLQTEARLAHLRSILKSITPMIATFKRLDEKARELSHLENLI